MKLYEHIDLARKFGEGKVGVSESLTEHQPDKTTIALTTAKRLSEAKQPEAKPIQLSGLPVSN